MRQALFISSCSYHDKKVVIDLGPGHSLEREYFLNSSLPNLRISDKRKNKKTLGFKQYGNNIIAINNSQNLSEIIKDEVAKGLQKKSITIDSNKILEIQIVNFNFNAKRGFVIGSSDSNVSLKAIIKDKNTNNKIIATRIFNLENNYTHFITSLNKTDSKNINLAIKKVIDDLLRSNEFLYRATKS